jgi:hypothetical protein
MVELNDAVRLLRAKRTELIEQLDAVDKALSVLNGVTGSATVVPEANPQETSARTPDTVLPTRLNPRRTLSDDHKHALKEGRRKARHSKYAAAGLAREVIDPSPELASGSRASGQPPRLVKRMKS